MKARITFVLVTLVAAVFVSGCASSQSSWKTFISLQAVNNTKEVIDRIEVRPEKNTQSVISRADKIPPGGKVALTLPLFEGWNYIIAYKGPRYSEKPFYVKNGDITEIVGNSDVKDKAIFSAKDFE